MGLTLLVLAAGMGSRYGGLKQLDGLGPSGETMMDYSVFDALRAGFDRVVFVIRRDFEAEFRAHVGSRYENRVKIEYAFQALDDLPGGFTVPADRVKPWGTGHAVYAARELLDEPFAVINADDFYGADSFRRMAEYFRRVPAAAGKVRGCIVAYVLRHTMSENGFVSRGICSGAEHLAEVVENTKIFYRGEKILSEQPDGSLLEFTGDEPVSMNCWGFMPEFVGELEGLFLDFLREKREVPKSEFFLPGAVDRLISEGRAEIAMLHSAASWFGVTYREDRPAVQASIAELVRSGEYPSRLFS